MDALVPLAEDGKRGPMDWNNLYSRNLTARQRKRLIVQLFGRKRRCDAGVPRTASGWLQLQIPPVPAYRRVTWAEVRRFERLRARGRSLRSIGRVCGRSHHTVARWLTGDR